MCSEEKKVPSPDWNSMSKKPGIVEHEEVKKELEKETAILHALAREWKRQNKRYGPGMVFLSRKDGLIMSAVG